MMQFRWDRTGYVYNNCLHLRHWSQVNENFAWLPTGDFLELVHMKFPGWPVIRHGSWDAGVLMEQSTNPMIEMEFEWAIYLLNGWFVVAKFDYQRHPLWFAFRLVQSRLKSVLTVLLCRHIRYPLVISHSYWTWPSKKNDLPSKNGGSFHSYVNVYQRVSIGIRLICREVSLDHGTCINMLGSQHICPEKTVPFREFLWTSFRQGCQPQIIIWT